MAYGYSTSLIIVLCAVMGICFIYRENRSSRRKLPPSLKTYQHVTTTEIVSACNYDGNQTHSYNSDIH